MTRSHVRPSLRALNATVSKPPTIGVADRMMGTSSPAWNTWGSVSELALSSRSVPCTSASSTSKWALRPGKNTDTSKAVVASEASCSRSMWLGGNEDPRRPGLAMPRTPPGTSSTSMVPTTDPDKVVTVSRVARDRAVQRVALAKRDRAPFALQPGPADGHGRGDQGVLVPGQPDEEVRLPGQRPDPVAHAGEGHRSADHQDPLVGGGAGDGVGGEEVAPS